MGTDNFECLKAPQMFSFQFIIENVTIFDGEHQNTDPLNRFELVEVPNVSEEENNAAQPKPQGKENQPIKGIPTEGKKKKKGKTKGKGKKKEKGKKKGKGKTPKKKAPIPPVPEEKPATVTKRKRIYLPPLRVDLRYFFNRTVTVDQVDLPELVQQGINVCQDTKPINNLAFDKGKKGKVKKGNKAKKGKKGKKQKGKKKKNKVKEVKPIIVPQEPPIEWLSEDQYSPEELSWKMVSEESFKRGLNITFPASPEQMILWLQRGPIKMGVYRWKGYGENIPIGAASLNFDSAPLTEMVLKRAQKLELGTTSCRADDTADIFNPLGEKIGEMNMFFLLICNGGTIISENLISEKGIFDFLGEESEKPDACETCGKFSDKYDYEVMDDNTIAVVPYATVFDNSPFVSIQKYKEYAEALFDVLSSCNPVSKFGEYLEKVAASGTSPEDTII